MMILFFSSAGTPTSYLDPDGGSCKGFLRLRFFEVFLLHACHACTTSATSYLGPDVGVVI